MILRGIETLALGKARAVEVSYEAGAYVDARGAPVKLLDMACHECMNRYYLLADEPIDFCPHCGHRRTAWASYDEARAWSFGHDFGWLHRLGRNVFAVRDAGGQWTLAIAPGADALWSTGRHFEVRALADAGPS